MKILVTGGLGFIGSHTVVELQSKGYDVIIIDNCSNASPEVLKGISAISGKTPEFENIDLREKSTVKEFFSKYPDIEGVIHFAASKAVGESVENPLLYYENNLTPLIYVLQELQYKKTLLSFLALHVLYTVKQMNYPLRKMPQLNLRNLLTEIQNR